MPSTDYQRIASAIDFLSRNVTRQPTLEELANHLHLSVYHTQRLFKRWAGVTPKQYLQVLTVERAKRLLTDSRSLLETSLTTGLSGSSRLHDHFVTLEAATPGDFQRRGKGLTITFGYHSTPLGEVFIATTARGICSLSFTDDHPQQALADLQQQWPYAEVVNNQELTRPFISRIFHKQGTAMETPLPIYVSGTNFQISVWKALLHIPAGHVVSYSDIAHSLGLPKASRAVGSAVGANPIAVLIPCHRVIRQSGALGGYRWGLQRKQALWLWENLEDEEV